MAQHQELIYYNVDLIHMAIRENKQIGFTYFDYDVHLKKHIRNNGAQYIQGGSHGIH